MQHTAQRRPFVMPPRPLIDVAGPPPDFRTPPFVPEPPPIDFDAVQQSIFDATFDPMRRQAAPAGPAVSAPIQADQGAPAPAPRQPSALRRGLERIVPIARSLAAGASAGAQAPDFWSALGPGLQADEALRKQDLAERQAEEKLAIDRAAAERQHRLDQAEIEERTARTKKTTAEAEAIPSKEQVAKSRAESYRLGQDSLVKLREDQGNLYKDQIKAGVAPARAKLLSEAAALHRARIRFEDNYRGLLSAAQIDALWALQLQRMAQAGLYEAQAELYEARAENLPAETRIEALKSDAAYINATAALQNAEQRRLQGTLTPRDAIRVRNDYNTARTRLLAAGARTFSPENKAAIDAALEKLDRDSAPLLKIAEEVLARPAPAAPAPAAPAAGAGTWEEYKRGQQ